MGRCVPTADGNRGAGMHPEVPGETTGSTRRDGRWQKGAREDNGFFEEKPGFTERARGVRTLAHEDVAFAAVDSGWGLGGGQCGGFSAGFSSAGDGAPAEEGAGGGGGAGEGAAAGDPAEYGAAEAGEC